MVQILSYGCFTMLEFVWRGYLAVLRSIWEAPSIFSLFFQSLCSGSLDSAEDSGADGDSEDDEESEDGCCSEELSLSNEDREAEDSTSREAAGASTPHAEVAPPLPFQDDSPRQAAETSALGAGLVPHLIPQSPSRRKRAVTFQEAIAVRILSKCKSVTSLLQTGVLDKNTPGWTTLAEQLNCLCGKENELPAERRETARRSLSLERSALAGFLQIPELCRLANELSWIALRPK